MNDHMHVWSENETHTFSFCSSGLFHSYSKTQPDPPKQID